MTEIEVAVIAGSTRPDRKADAVARWVIDQASPRADARFTLVDLAPYPLPFLDEQFPAVHGHYQHEHTKEWAATIDHFDAYVFVLPEYNHSIPAVLKNAIDFLHAEWRDKAAGLVGYGVDANGARAVEHMRLVLGELQVADVRGHVLLSLLDDFAADGRPTPRPHAEQRLDQLLDQVLAWGAALRGLRAGSAR